jgi:hypothetical protein
VKQVAALNFAVGDRITCKQTRHGGVPRYFFNLRDDVILDDEEGQEFADLAAAEDRAERYVLEMAAVSIAEHRRVNLHHRIEVADEAGRVVLTVEFGDVLTVIT